MYCDFTLQRYCDTITHFMTHNQFQQYADLHIDTTKKTLGVVLDYNEESILKIDEIISKGWPNAQSVIADSIILLFGSFLGEAMRHVFGGEWIETEQGWGLKINDTVTVFPFAKIKKRFVNGMGDSITYYYQSVKAVLDSESKKDL